MSKRPTHPGEILKEEFAVGLTQKELAKKLRYDIKVINRLMNRKTSVTPKMAIRLGKFFRTTAEFWMNAQIAHDLFMERNKHRYRIKNTNVVNRGVKGDT